MTRSEDRDSHPETHRVGTDGSTLEPAVVVRHDFEDQTSELTVTVVDAVSQAADVSPTEIVPRVNDHVDPDALDRLFRPRPDGSTRRGRVTFELLGHTVEIVGDGTVLVFDR